MSEAGQEVSGWTDRGEVGGAEDHTNSSLMVNQVFFVLPTAADAGDNQVVEGVRFSPPSRRPPFSRKRLLP